MTTQEAIQILHGMYHGADFGESVAHIHLFGIKYAGEIEGLNLQEIAREATGHSSYGSEISKGRKLAKYVTPKPGV